MLRICSLAAAIELPLSAFIVIPLEVGGLITPLAAPPPARIDTIDCY